MAGKDSKGNNTSKPKQKTQRYNDVVFISYPLNDEQKADIKAADWGLADVDNALVHLTEENYKVTVSYDDYSSAYACFITPKGGDHHNAGYILTGRGSLPYKAIKQAYYIHAALLEGDWSAWKDEAKTIVIDD